MFFSVFFGMRKLVLIASWRSRRENAAADSALQVKDGVHLLGGEVGVSLLDEVEEVIQLERPQGWQHGVAAVEESEVARVGTKLWVCAEFVLYTKL